MTDILDIVAPIFLILGAGYAARFLRALQDSEIDALSRFTATFAVPPFLCLAVARLDLHEAMRPALMAAFYGSAVVCFALGALLGRFAFGRRPGEAVAAGFCALFGNTVFLGLPIIERAFDDAVIGATVALIALHAPIMYLVGVASMESVARDGGGLAAGAAKVARSLSRNPLVIGVAAGFAINLSGLAIPLPAQEAMSMMGQAALTAGLFAVGASLARYDLRSEALETVAVTLIKIILHPALAYVLAVYVFDLPKPTVIAATMLAAMPGGMNIYLFATLYRRSESLAAAALLTGTAASALTIPLWLLLLTE